MSPGCSRPCSQWVERILRPCCQLDLHRVDSWAGAAGPGMLSGTDVQGHLRPRACQGLPDTDGDADSSWPEPDAMGFRTGGGGLG